MSVIQLILSAFPEELGPDAKKIHEHDLQNRNRERQNGHFMFEQRVRKSAALEERAEKKALEREKSQKNLPTNNGYPVSPLPTQKSKTHKQHSSLRKLQDMVSMTGVVFM